VSLGNFISTKQTMVDATSLNAGQESAPALAGAAAITVIVEQLPITVNPPIANHNVSGPLWTPRSIAVLNLAAKFAQLVAAPAQGFAV
jgi:hypothetical protein